jgi:alginate O-acetyltransferase complex protein AlgI
MCWRVEYAVLLVFSTLVDYFAGLQMSKLNVKRKKRKYLIFALICNLGLLFTFKYFNFFSESIHNLFGVFNIFYQAPELKILLPVGISFYTFQTLSYSIDIYRGKMYAEKNIGIFALYVSFFPQLVAGPIERAKNLLPQFRENHDFDYNLMLSGLKLMLWGFFKKIVIADRLGQYIATVYNDPVMYHGFPVFIATSMFYFQLYCDFSGYSDIAVGSARTMGYRLMRNFNRPYIARSFSDFWSRWHISLNTWFRDYVLFAMPFGKNKKLLKFRVHLNLFIVVVIIGLWHGAKWTYVLWGVLMGIYMVGESLTINLRKKFESVSGLTKMPSLHRAFDIMVIFVFISASPLLFRADSLNDFVSLVSNAFNFTNIHRSMIQVFKENNLLNFMLIIFLICTENFHAKRNIPSILGKMHVVLRWSVYLVFIFAILILGIFNEDQFIYFQF